MNSLQNKTQDELDEEHLMNDPVMQRVMEKYFDKRFKDLQAGKEDANTTNASRHKGKIHKNHRDVNVQQTHAIKSPSDTTIYTPAIQKRAKTRDMIPIPCECNLVNEFQQQMSLIGLGRTSDFVSIPMNNSVNTLIETVHNEQHPQDGRRAMETNTEEELEQAQIRADKALAEAERMKAQIEQPPGIYLQNQGIPNIGSGVSDDDFFHLTCYIDPSLILKIEKGEFVELEKLLPNDKANQAEESRLEWVQRDGGTFLVPAQKANKISNFRRWEQAFRAYATIYCSANPHRSKEIWQYITVINTAASSYLWDNVYNYDITFRHLMAFNPNRSWAVTYNQMWNLSMRDPIPKNSFKNLGTSHFTGNPNYKQGSSAGAHGSGSGGSGGKRNKSDYCWDFNKGVPCKFGAKCKFVERCKYCDSPSHGVHVCPKLQKKEGGNTSNAK